MRLRRVVIISAAVVSIIFSAYLWGLYRQLKDAFESPEQFIPTRIYSDVTRIAPPDTRVRVEARLKGLAYGIEKKGTQVWFQLHSISYPSYLIPDGHPTVGAQDKQIILQFDGEGADSLLQSIMTDGKEIPELYLEPELVATLARGTKGDSKLEVRELVKLDDIPAAVPKAIIAIEDQHFLDHSGFDPRGIARAVLVNLKTLSLAQGGSTITQQLVKNLMARRTKNIFRKANELFLALLLEATFEKEQIMERYLNEVYLGQIGSLEIHGVAEGAKHFFGKPLKDLNLGEIALMAGLIRGPGYYSPYRYKDRATERQKLVLKKMVETGQIAEAEADEALRQPLRLAPPSSSSNKAPFFTDFVKAELIRELKDRMPEEEIAQAGLRVYTTLDLTLNTIAQQSVAGGIADLEKRLKLQAPNRLEGALAAVDHSTGYVRALIGGRSYAQSTFNRILNMKRQVGSTFKPIVYLAAIEKGADSAGVPYGPGHPAEDGPWKLTYDRGKQTWAPRNYEKGFLGWTSYRQALAHSVNTIAARVGYEVGPEKLVQVARALGIESEMEAVPSLSLGVAELSPIELLRVYAAFANHGLLDDLTVIRGITQDDGSAYMRFIYNPKQVIDPGAADLLTDMLQSVFTDGTARDAHRLGFDRPAAGKTGTTSNHRDSWFAGYTPQLTAVVWVGMDQTGPESTRPGKKPVAPLTGGTSALPIWVSFMKEALEGEPPAAFPMSPHLTNVLVDIRTGKQARQDCPATQTVVEKYVKGLEPKDDSCEPLWPKSTTETVGN